MGPGSQEVGGAPATRLVAHRPRRSPRPGRTRPDPKLMAGGGGRRSATAVATTGAALRQVRGTDHDVAPEYVGGPPPSEVCLESPLQLIEG
jgi:hypothetical protein